MKPLRHDIVEVVKAENSRDKMKPCPGDSSDMSRFRLPRLGPRERQALKILFAIVLVGEAVVVNSINLGDFLGGPSDGRAALVVGHTDRFYHTLCG